MDETSHSLEEMLFSMALRLPAADEREAFLDRVCREKPGLRAALDDLLASHFGGTGFLTGPIPRRPVPFNDESAAPGAHSATVLGRYTLLEKIGEGGFGDVWMAEQREPVRRRVALKIIKPGMDSRQVVARFEAERQALAMMDHSSIARIFDADVTDAGRPFFVMELVRGLRITDYCDQNQLTTHQRLELAIKVCQAIQHAHQKGIIHRDIKPSNILVTVNDGAPVPKVIDFGIAKAMQGELTERTVFTQFQQLIGTPAYISPEQAEMSSLDIDTRADIYSLGVLLYELLVGQTPFDAKEMMMGGLDTLREVILKQEPLRPSTRLSTMPSDARTTASERRRTDESKLVHQLQGDLDWIVMKCLEKDRTRRYDTANGLAMDIQRYLANEPVTARPPSAAYRFQKTWQRNKPAFATGAAVAFALVMGTGISIWQAMEATQAKRAEAGQRAFADAAKVAAETARAGELSLRQQAELETRRARLLAYDSDMKLAERSLAENHLGRARELLDRHRPHDGDEDLRGWEWRFLWQRARSDEHFTFWHAPGDEVLDLAFSPDGRFLSMRPGHGRPFELFDVPTRSQVTKTTLAGEWYSMAFSPVTPVVACSGRDSDGRWVLKFLTLPDLSPLDTISLHFPMDRLIYSGDGKFLFGADRRDLRIKSWDVAASTFVQPFPDFVEASGIGKSIKATSPDGRWLAVGTSKGAIRLCRLPDAVTDPPIQATEEGVVALAFSPDSRWIASSAGFTDARVRVWEVEGGREVALLKGHGAYVQCLAFLPDGRTLVSGSSDQTIRFWDVPSQSEVAVLRGHESEIRCLSYSAATGQMASGGKDGDVKFWIGDPQRSRESWTRLPAKLRSVVRFSSDSLAWSPDSAIFAIAEETGQGTENVQFWDARRLERLPETCSITDVRAMVFTADGSELLLGTRSGLIRSYSCTSRQLTKRQFELGDDLFTLKYVNGGQQLAVVGATKLAVLDATTWQVVRHFTLPTMGYCSAAINSAGTRLIRGEYGETRGNGDLEFVDLQSGEVVRSRRPFGGSLTSGCAFLPDDRHAVVINGSARPVSIWDASTHTKVRELRGHLLSGHGGSLSGDGQRLVTTSTYPESVKIWDMRMEGMRELLNLSAPGGIFQAGGFSPDGSIVFAIENRGSAYFWRAPSWEEIAAAEDQAKMKR